MRCLLRRLAVQRQRPCSRRSGGTSRHCSKDREYRCGTAGFLHGPAGTVPIFCCSVRRDDGKNQHQHAGLEELQTLPGIGEKRAQAIVDDREANGPFRIPEDLTRVSGIGEGILANIIDSITVE